MVKKDVSSLMNGNWDKGTLTGNRGHGKILKISGTGHDLNARVDRSVFDKWNRAVVCTREYFRLMEIDSDCSI